MKLSYVILPVLISILSALTPGKVTALVTSASTITGNVKSFDAEKVVVENETHTYEVPAKYVGAKKLKSGSKINLLVSEEQLKEVKISTKKSKK